MTTHIRRIHCGSTSKSIIILLLIVRIEHHAKDMEMNACAKTRLNYREGCDSLIKARDRMWIIKNIPDACRMWRTGCGWTWLAQAGQLELRRKEISGNSLNGKHVFHQRAAVLETRNGRPRDSTRLSQPPIHLSTGCSWWFIVEVLTREESLPHFVCKAHPHITHVMLIFIITLPHLFLASTSVCLSAVNLSEHGNGSFQLYIFPREFIPTAIPIEIDTDSSPIRTSGLTVYLSCTYSPCDCATGHGRQGIPHSCHRHDW